MELAAYQKFKLNNRSPKNKAEQLPIFKALEVTKSIENEDNSSNTATILSESRISVDLLKKSHNRS